MNIFFDENKEYTFVCTKCNKMLSYKYLSEDNEICINCLEGNTIEEVSTRENEHYNEIQSSETFVNNDIHLQSTVKGLKKMPFIDTGDSLIQIDTIISVEKKVANDSDFEEDKSKKQDKLFCIEINTRSNKSYHIGRYTEKKCIAKLNEIKKFIKKEQKIYKI